MRITREESLSGIYTDPAVSYASKCPDVPPPEPQLSPGLLAARWLAHDLRGEEMPSLAADLLESGLDTPALRRLAGESSVLRRADIETLVERMFCELSVPYPLTEDDAKPFETRQIAREVIAGERNAWAAASHVEIVVWGRKSDNPAVERIFRLNDEINWDEPNRRPGKGTYSGINRNVRCSRRFDDKRTAAPRAGCA